MTQPQGNAGRRAQDNNRSTARRAARIPWPASTGVKGAQGGAGEEFAGTDETDELGTETEWGVDHKGGAVEEAWRRW